MLEIKKTESKIRAGIIGGAGYTGGEMLRILLQHPYVEIVFVHSRSHANQPVYAVHTDLLGETSLHFTDRIHNDIDVLLLCVGHTEALVFLQQNEIPKDIRIIDLSQDFRLLAAARCNEREFVYGLPELSREKIKTAANIANPGCFATAIQLGLLPLAHKGLLKEVHTSGITGATGAGQKLQGSSHFAWRVNNIQAYKSLNHQHVAEIVQSLKMLQADFGELNFMPLRGDFARGIYVTSYTKCTLSLNEAYELYLAYYKNHPFTFVSKQMIDMKQAVNTNKCLLHLEKQGEQLIIHSAIDNLLKGASGQAIQNLNIMFNLPEDSGLHLKSIAF